MKIKALRNFKDKGAKPGAFSFNKTYEVEDGKGKFYIANGWTVDAKEQKEPVDPELEALRESYKEKAGKKPHHSWDAEKIEEKIKELDDAKS